MDAYTQGGQINIIDDHYSVYITSEIKGDRFLSIAHTVLSRGIKEGSLIAGSLFREINSIIEEDEIELANLRIDNSYGLFYNISITIDLKHNVVEVDGGDNETDNKLKRYNRYKMTIEYFLKEFFNEACL